MSDQSPASWAELFAGKTSAQILWTSPPEGLSESESHRFRAARLKASTAALGAERAASKQAEGGTQAAEREAAQPASATPDDPNRERKQRDVLQKQDATEETAPALAASKFEPIPLVIAMGRCEEQLERQLASGSGLIEHLVQYIARCDSDVQACLNFADRICSLMKSSAGVAKAVGRLRGLGPEETRHRVFVEYAPHGGGVLRT
jgi:hypothetical protein